MFKITRIFNNWGQKWLLRCRISLQILFQGDRRNFIFVLYFKVIPKIVKFWNFDHIQLPRFNGLSSSRKCASILIWITAIKIWCLLVLLNFFLIFEWPILSKNDTHRSICPSLDVKRIERLVWTLTDGTKKPQEIEWCKPQDRVLGCFGVMSC